MKKIIIPLLLFVLVGGLVQADEFEIGMSFTPLIRESEAREGNETAYEDNKTDNNIPGFHFGYTWWGFFHASWDALVLPPDMISGMTSWYDETNEIMVQGPYRPGFLNMFDVGIRPQIGPVILMATVGINTIYIHGQNVEGLVDMERVNPDLGANLRFGVGWKFDFWGLMITGTQIYPSFGDITDIFGGIINGSPQERREALNELQSNIVPSIVINLYL